ncbi:MAG: hypothetical protein VX254_08690, partial [Planctomycetota bacterium]|nr:hypothetical protein [Planctomycetota bacterium]
NQEIAAIENAPRQVAAGSTEPANPAATAAAPRPEPRPQPPRRPQVQQPPPRPAAGKSDLTAVKDLISRAGNYYSIARRDEKKRSHFKKAYETLRDAQDLLGEMPSTDDVRKMRSRVATQMLDVSKSLGFFDF